MTALWALCFRLPDLSPEALCLTEPDVVENVHRLYVESGSDIIYANTFGANAHKLEDTGYNVQEIIPAAIAVAKRAAGNKAYVALDIGPIGEMLEPYGTLSFERSSRDAMQVPIL